MALLDTQISALAARFTNKVVNAQVNQAVPFLGSGALKKVPMKGKQAVVNVLAGAIDSTLMMGDAGALPSGSATTPSQGTEQAAYQFSRISIGQGAAIT